MLTKNFYQAMRAYLSGSTLGSALTSTSGSAMNCTGEMYSSSFGNIVTAFANASNNISFGDGSVPPSINDYWLSGNKISTISVLARSANSSIDDERVSISSTMTVKNTSTTDTIVINEIGVVAMVYTSKNTGGSAMVDRTVLDAPLTLAPEEQGVITYTINFPFVQ